MFLNPKILNRLMKEADKSETLTLTDQTDPVQGECLEISSTYWRIILKKAIIPNETLGDIAKLVRVLPENQESFTNTKGGRQSKMWLKETLVSYRRRYLDEKTCRITDLILMEYDVAQRVLQSSQDGLILINELFVDMVDPSRCEPEEERDVEIHYNQNRVLFSTWSCMLEVDRRFTRKHEKTIEEMRNIDFIGNKEWAEAEAERILEEAKK